MSSESVSTHDLLIQLKAKNDEAMEILYPRFVGEFRRYGLRRGLSEEKAMDATHDTFVKIARRIDCYDEERGKAEAWIWSIHVFTVIDHCRSNRYVIQEKELDECDIVIETASPEQHAIEYERGEAIIRAFRRLSASAQRMILRHLDGGRGPKGNGWNGVKEQFLLFIQEEEEK